MEGLALLFIVLFVGINLVQGTLFAAILPLLAGAAVYIVLCSLGPGTRNAAVSETSEKLMKDIRLLERCRKKWLDSHVCLSVGAKEVDIRRDIHKTRAVLESLGNYRGGPDAEVEALFGRSQPTRVEVSILRSELQERLKTLQCWLEDSALREILYTTGKFYTSEGIDEELRRRRSRIAALSAAAKRRGGMDVRIAAILGIVTALFMPVGLIGAFIYGALYLGNR
jgi:hypothetical protein